MVPKKKSTKSTKKAAGASKPKASTASKPKASKPKPKAATKAAATAPTTARKTRAATKRDLEAGVQQPGDEEDDGQGAAGAEDDESAGEAELPKKPAKKPAKRSKRVVEEEDEEEEEPIAGPSTRRPASKKAKVGRGKDKAVSSKRARDIEDYEADEDESDPRSDERPKSRKRSKRAASPDADDPAEPPADDTGGDGDEADEFTPIRALGGSVAHHDCIFDENNATLTVRLKVHADPDGFVSRLGYTAELNLRYRREGEAKPREDVIGSITSWRIAKATVRYSNAESREWLDELLSVRKKHPMIEETAKCMQIIFNREGQLKRSAREHAEELDERSLMFIEMIYIRGAFARRGLLRPALEAWCTALRTLHEWFAFSETLILVPSRPEGSKGDTWGDMDDAQVEAALVPVYEKYGFETWVEGKVRDEGFTVMGRKTGGEPETEDEEGDAQ